MLYGAYVNARKASSSRWLVVSSGTPVVVNQDLDF